MSKTNDERHRYTSYPFVMFRVPETKVYEHKEIPAQLPNSPVSRALVLQANSTRYKEDNTLQQRTVQPDSIQYKKEDALQQRTREYESVLRDCDSLGKRPMFPNVQENTNARKKPCANGPLIPTSKALYDRTSSTSTGAAGQRSPQPRQPKQPTPASASGTASIPRDTPLPPMPLVGAPFDEVELKLPIMIMNELTSLRAQHQRVLNDLKHLERVAIDIEKDPDFVDKYKNAELKRRFIINYDEIVELITRRQEYRERYADLQYCIRNGIKLPSQEDLSRHRSNELDKHLKRQQADLRARSQLSNVQDMCKNLPDDQKTEGGWFSGKVAMRSFVFRGKLVILVEYLFFVIFVYMSNINTNTDIFLVCGPDEIEYMPKELIKELRIPVGSVRFANCSANETTVKAQSAVPRRPLVFKKVNDEQYVQMVPVMPVLPAPPVVPAQPVIQAPPVVPAPPVQQPDEIWRPMEGVAVNVTRVMAMPLHIQPQPPIVGCTHYLETPGFDDISLFSHVSDVIVEDDIDEDAWLDYTFAVLTNSNKQIFPVGRALGKKHAIRVIHELEYERPPEHQWLPDEFVTDRNPFPSELDLGSFASVCW